MSLVIRFFHINLSRTKTYECERRKKNVPIPIQVGPAVIFRNNHRVPEVLFTLEHLSFVAVLSLKGTSEGGMSI